jgi:prepilin-type N-terminal cleavage/methylation domain-containing protein
MNCYEKGFTIIELLIVIGIIAVLAAATTPFLSQIVLRVNTETTLDKTISAFRKAQSYAMDGKDNSAVWGACITTDGSDQLIRLYSGSCAVPSFSEDFSVPETVTITDGGVRDVIFTKTRGEPSASITLAVTSSLDTKTITINSAGGMEIN